MRRATLFKAMAGVAVHAFLALGVMAAPIGRDSSNRYFTDTSGKPVFLIGYYFWGSVVDGEYIDHPSRYHQMMDDGQPYGLNYIRISLGINRFTATTNPPSWNGQPNSTPFLYVNGKADLNQWNNTFWAGIREQVEYAAARGFIAHVCIFDGYDISKGTYAYQWPGSFWNRDNQTTNFFGDLDIDNDNNADEDGNFWRAGDFNNNFGVGVYQRRVIDKAIAEVGSYDNVMFELGNETFGASTTVRNAMINYIRTKTSKVITVNQKDIETMTGGAGDGAAQHIAASALDLKARIARFVGKGWPAWEDPDGNPLVGATADELRQGAWYSLAGGAAAWGGFTYDFNGGPGGFDTAKATYYGNLVSFVKTSGLKFWTMLPDHDLVGNKSLNSCLADNGREYLVYVQRDTNVNVDLSDLSGSANYRIYSPKTNDFTDVQTVAGNGVRNFIRPVGASDWVIHIVKNTIDFPEWTGIQPWNGRDESGPTDLDSDSLSTFLEYAFDLDPLVPDPPDSSPQFAINTIIPDGPWITFTYRRNRLATDLTYTVRTSDNLETWAPVVIDGVNAIEEIIEPDPDLDGSAETVRVRIKQQPEDPARFISLKVSE